VTSDDGFRLKIDNAPVLNYWIDQGASVYEVTVTSLQQGFRGFIVEYYEGTGQATIKVEWRRSTQAYAVISLTSLYPTVPISPTPTPTPRPECAVNFLVDYAAVPVFPPTNGTNAFNVANFTNPLLTGGITRQEQDQIREKMMNELNFATDQYIRYALDNGQSLPQQGGIYYYPNNAIPTSIEILTGVSQLTASPQLYFVNLVGVNGVTSSQASCGYPNSTIDTTTFNYAPISQAFMNNLYEMNPPNAISLLDTQYELTTFLSTYRDNLIEVQSALARCGSNNQTCVDRVNRRILIQAQNRFNTWIYVSATNQDNPVPPLLLKMLLLAESQMQPAFAPNNASAVGIAQFVEVGLAGVAEIMANGRDSETESHYSVTISNGDEMEVYLDGIRNSCTPPRQNPTSEVACVDFFEVTEAIEEAAWFLYVTRSRIRNSVGSRFDLFPVQDQWLLAAAGYNSGAGSVSAAIMQTSTNTLAAVCPYLQPESQSYVRRIRNGDPQLGGSGC
jgi:hypothetical protein